MKKNIAMMAFLIISIGASGQKTKHPKLIVGIVVDQMRYDYIDKFYSTFGEGGFKKLVDEGFYCRNVNYNYKPTYTGPGHASIFTGTTPAIHGIVGNNWFSRAEETTVYCANEKGRRKDNFYSPRRMLSETFADGIKQYFNFKSKAYGVSLKDRGAILPAGHLADGAYWFDSNTGEWVSSSYYKNAKPKWLSTFNESDLKKRYIDSNWELSLAKDRYEMSLPDENDFENALVKGGRTTFPYDLTKLFEERSWGLLKQIPQGNSMTADLAKEIIENEELGVGEVTDFLSISFSATDYVGHTFGVQSLEVQDTYVKLDKTLALLIKFIEEKLGKENVLLFLTADHGAGMPRKYLEKHRLPNGFIDVPHIEKGLEQALDQKYGEATWVEAFINLNVYFADAMFIGPEKAERLKFAKDYLQKQSGILQVVDMSAPISINNEVELRTVLGHNKNRSGDFVLIEEVNWTTYPGKGSTHGSPYSYDTHVPFIVYGFSVKPGSTVKKYDIVNIAPTISFISSIPFNNSGASINISEVKR